MANKIHGHFMVFIVHFWRFSWFLPINFMVILKISLIFHGLKKKIVKQSFASRAAGEFFLIPLIFVQTLRKISKFMVFMVILGHFFKIHGPP